MMLNTRARAGAICVGGMRGEWRPRRRGGCEEWNGRAEAGDMHHQDDHNHRPSIIPNVSPAFHTTCVPHEDVSPSAPVLISHLPAPPNSPPLKIHHQLLPPESCAPAFLNRTPAPPDTQFPHHPPALRTRHTVGAVARRPAELLAGPSRRVEPPQWRRLPRSRTASRENQGEERRGERNVQDYFEGQCRP